MVLTGARQTGKTTLARVAWPDVSYVNLDDLDVRTQLREIPASAWHSSVGVAVLDEAQKEPSVFEKVKYAYDNGSVPFSVLLGSSRILLLSQVRETLAGRSFLFDLWPLMPGELLSEEGDTASPPLIDLILDSESGPAQILQGAPPILLGEEDANRREAIDHLATWGGMPELLRLEDGDRREWLRSYQQTFLERDLSDLARISDLEPFRKLQRLAMLRTARLLSFSELARDAGIAPTTARRYLEYLRISYQVVLLQPWSRNLTSVAVKSPKLYWIDLGILRQATRQHGALTGELFETLVVSELHKWCSTMAKDVDLFFYRTRSGREVDLIVQTAHGIVGIEIKLREQVTRSDLRSLRAVADHLGDEWLGGMVIHRGNRIHRLDDARSIWAVPVHRLF